MYIYICIYLYVCIYIYVIYICYIYICYTYIWTCVPVILLDDLHITYIYIYVCVCYVYVYLYKQYLVEGKFRSQTSDNMDR